MHKYIFLFLLTLLFWADTFSGAWMEFSPIDRMGISAMTFIVLFFQILLLKISSLKIRNRLITNICFGSIITFNIYCLNLSISSTFIQNPIYLNVLVIIFALFTTTTLLNMMDEVKRFRFWLLPFVFVLLAGNIAYTAIKLNTNEPTSILSSKIENYKLVKFKETPNIYIILFDSLVPKPILMKHLGIEKVLYHDVLDKNFHRFKNFFVDNAPTQASITSFLALDKRYLASLGSKKYGLFKGDVESPLLKVFKQNGYETNTSYDSGHFGHGKGLYVDNYLVRKKFSACEFIHKNTKVITFFGYCSITDNPYINKLLNPKSRIDFIMDNFKTGLSKAKPQIFINYIYSPGHTPQDYDHKNKEALKSYASQYKVSSKKTASYLEKIIDFVEQEDPSAMIYVFGDHGPWLSRRTTYKEDKEFFIQDRFAVYGGFYPRDKCQKSFSKPYTREYITARQGAYMIIRCLSGGEDAFVDLDNYDLPFYTEKGADSYANYLYE